MNVPIHRVSTEGYAKRPLLVVLSASAWPVGPESPVKDLSMSVEAILVSTRVCVLIASLATPAHAHQAILDQTASWI